MIENILAYSIGSLFWGILIAIVCMCLFLFLIKGWYKDAYFKPVSYIIAIILGTILVYNCTIICGAIAIKLNVNSFENQVVHVVKSNFPDYDAVVDQRTSNDIIQQVVKEHPILLYYVGSGNFEGWKLSELPNVMSDTLRSYLNNIIIKKIAWSLGFVILGAIIAIKTIGRNDSVKRQTTRLKPRPATRIRRTTRRR
ncbi:MAG: hypothetical protein HDS65_07310 [Bacteroidales bacterium]|nr:hypothetical protein [Bacteroidales bacterium]